MKLEIGIEENLGSYFEDMSETQILDLALAQVRAAVCRNRTQGPLYDGNGNSYAYFEVKGTSK